jgi:nucleotide-binding universal stress UspA family protein
VVEIRRILWPCDFSRFSKRALSVAVVLAKRYRATVTAFHVLPSAPQSSGFASMANPALLHTDASVPVRATLEEWTATARSDQVPVKVVAHEGDEAREILATARTLPADLIVMGTHGRSGFSRYVLGSVTEAVLAGAPCPVLTVPGQGVLPTANRPFRSVVWATDFSSRSTDALAYACSIAAASQARLLTVHVLADLRADLRPHRHVDETELVADLEARARDCLRNAVSQELRTRCEIEEVLLAGKAHVEIVRLARERSAELIVIGAPGKTCLQVVRASPCPVLAVGPPH